jgi:hypothetical protein
LIYTPEKIKYSTVAENGLVSPLFLIVPPEVAVVPPASVMPE